MSEYLNNPMMEYRSATPGPRRPTSVTVLAIIGIIVGGLGTLSFPIAMVPYIIRFGPPNPVIDAVKSHQAMLVYMICTMVIGWLFAMALLVGSIGLLLLQEWARRCMLVYGWGSIIMGVIGLIINALWLFPIKWHAVQGTPAEARFIGGTIGGLASFILPIFVVIYVRKEHVCEAFAQSASATGY